jgi:Catalytic LigB subunit of aromatic ring-opening dioxygenase
MARLVAAFGSSHSPMLAARAEDWDGGFLTRDRSRAHVDLDGNPCGYDALLGKAPGDALERIAPDRLARRHAEVQASIARLAGDIAAAKLDALIVVGDDQEELFDQSNMPAIGIYYGETIRNAGQGSLAGDDWMARARRRYLEPAGPTEHPCHPVLARHLIEALQRDGFDVSVMRGVPEGKYEGHAYSYVHRFCLPDGVVPIVPVFLNAYFAPNQPTPGRCFALGEALADAVAAFPADQRVGIMASGGLSHFVVDEAFDRALLDALRRKDAAFFRTAPLAKLQSGSSEIRNWICLAGASGALDVGWASYVPGYRTPALTGTGLAFASLR